MLLGFGSMLSIFMVYEMSTDSLYSAPNIAIPFLKENFVKLTYFQRGSGLQNCSLTFWHNQTSQIENWDNLGGRNLQKLQFCPKSKLIFPKIYDQAILRIHFSLRMYFQTSQKLAKLHFNLNEIEQIQTFHIFGSQKFIKIAI